jgi:integrase/recombinase XerC
MIRSWLAELNAEGMKPTTIKRKVSSLKSFYTYLIREGTIGDNPASRLSTPKNQKRLPVYVNKSETNRMLDGLELTGSYKEIISAVIIFTLYHTGIRLSELLNLKTENVDFVRNTLKVLGKRNKERIIPFGIELHVVLQRLSEIKEEKQLTGDYLLCNENGSKLYPVYIYRVVNTMLRANTSATKKSPHVLRHSLATHLLHNGADLNSIKELLGHSQLTATQIYTHNNIEELKATYKLAHPKS